MPSREVKGIAAKGLSCSQLVKTKNRIYMVGFIASLVSLGGPIIESNNVVSI